MAVDPQETDALVEAWDAEQLDVSLKVIASPYREVTNPVLDYVASLRTENPRNVICVYIPEYEEEDNALAKEWAQALPDAEHPGYVPKDSAINPNIRF